jgi:hypothetical protein
LERRDLESDKRRAFLFAIRNQRRVAADVVGEVPGAAAAAFGAERAFEMPDDVPPPGAREVG